MMYPLVRELAAAAAPCRVPVAVTCRVLGLARQPYYRWLDRPVTDAELTEAYRANALFDAHRDDPEFGHRFLLDEARAAGEAMAERTAWRICRDNGWWSAFGKRRGRGKNAKAGPPVHDDPVRRPFTADGPIRMRNAKHRRDPAPLESDCGCYTCTRFSRAYLHHLFAADEMLGPTLLSLHNVAYYLRLMADARTAITGGRFESFRAACAARWNQPPHSPGGGEG